MNPETLVLCLFFTLGNFTWQIIWNKWLSHKSWKTTLVYSLGQSILFFFIFWGLYSLTSSK